jgi:hypothetical protein
MDQNKFDKQLFCCVIKEAAQIFHNSQSASHPASQQNTLKRAGCLCFT